MPETNLLRSTALTNSDYSSVLQVMQARAALGEPTLSFEFFPPKDEASEVTLRNSFAELMKVSPDYVSVTYGAGGSNRERSLSVVDFMAREVLTIGHLTCVGASRARTEEIVKRFEAAKVGAILAIRGDSPKDNPEALQIGELKSALDNYIKDYVVKQEKTPEEYEQELIIGMYRKNDKILKEFGWAISWITFGLFFLQQ